MRLFKIAEIHLQFCQKLGLKNEATYDVQNQTIIKLTVGALLCVTMEKLRLPLAKK